MRGSQTCDDEARGRKFGEILTVQLGANIGKPVIDLLAIPEREIELRS